MCEPISASTATAISLSIAATSAVSSIAMGVYSAQQAASQARATMNMQARQQQQNMDMQRQAMVMQQDQQQRQLALQQRQNQDNLNLQVNQANAQTVNQYNVARQQVLNERTTIMAKNAADRLTYQRATEAANVQVQNNNEAANKIYVAEQSKVNEARKQALFEQQAILSKSIGNAGTVLAAGRTGQSVGLLTMDVERQKGFALAQQSATLDSKREAAVIAMDGGWLQAQNATNQVMSGLPFKPTDPYLPQMPDTPTFVNGIGLAIDPSLSSRNA